MLQITQDGNARTTDAEPSTWELTWSCDRNLPAGSEVDLRGANLRTLISVRWHDFTCSDRAAEQTWYVGKELSFNDILNATTDGDDFLIVSNPAWPSPSPGKPVFGEIHWHTNISGDGMREMPAALHAARDLLNLDFVAPGDHNPQGEDWSKTVAVLESFNDPGRFAAFFGWEASSNQDHENFYFTDSNHPLVCGGSAGLCSDAPAGNTPLLDEQKDFIAIPHHTNAVSKAIKDDGSRYWLPYPWRQPQNDYRRLVEIFQTRGNQERETYPDDDLWRVLYSDNGGSVQTALDAGHRFGFTGGADNHTGWPTMPSRFPGANIYTGIWVTQRERQAVCDGLFARHTWACWDTPAIVRFTINDVLQGGLLRVPSGTKLTASIAMSVEAPLQLLELVTENDTAIPVNDLGVDLGVCVEVDLGSAETSTCFYLRALQTDGAIIYTSPIFIEPT